jgi:site-specific DNA recombinase
MPVAVYARVSTQRQAQAQTIEQQLERLRAHCDAQSWTLRDTYVFRDDGYSGASLHRPGLDRLREAAAAGEVDRVLLTAPDRLARNYVHQTLLLEELEQVGCTVEFLDRPMSCDPNDQLLLQIRGAVAEYERSVIAERMRRGRQRKLRAGLLLPWTRAPYGYRLDTERPRDPAGVRVEPGEAAVVQEIFASYLADAGSLLGLAKLLGRRQIPTPNGQKHWSTATVRGILTNPSYTGHVYAGRTQTQPPRNRHSATHPIGRPSTTSVPTAPETWIPVATIPAVVSAEQFEQVQAKLARNQQFARRHNTTHDYLLRALVSCGVCQMACVGRSDPHHAYDYYVCRGKGPPEASHRAERCPARYTPAQQLDELVWQDLCAVLTHPASIADALDRAHGGQWSSQELQARRDLLRQGRIGLEHQRDRLTDAYLGGVIPLPEYQRRRAELEQKLEGIEQQAGHLTVQAAQQADVAAHVRGATDFCDRVQAGLADATFAQRRQMVELLIDRVVVLDGEVEIRYVIPTSLRGEHTRFCHLRLDYFDAPVAPNRSAEGRSFQGSAEQVVASLAGAFVADPPFGRDHADRPQPGPVVTVLQPGESVSIGDDAVVADLDPTVPFADGPILVDDEVVDGAGLGVGEQVDHVVGEGFLVLLERQHVVAFLIEDLLGDLPLTAHGVNRDDAARDRQRAQQFGDGGDLVGLVVDLDLRQDQSVGTGPGTDHVDRGLPVGSIVRAAHGLAVEGDHRRRHNGAHRFHPVREARLKLLWIEGCEHAIEGIVRGNAVGQVQERPQPLALRLPELSDLVPTLGTADHGAQGDGEDRHQRMQLGPLDARVVERGEMLTEGMNRRRSGHGRLPASQDGHYLSNPCSPPSPGRI